MDVKEVIAEIIKKHNLPKEVVDELEAANSKIKKGTLNWWVISVLFIFAVIWIANLQIDKYQNKQDFQDCNKELKAALMDIKNKAEAATELSTSAIEKVDTVSIQMQENRQLYNKGTKKINNAIQELK